MLEGCRNRVLFLDDDPARAAEFLARNPGAVWVETAEECLGCLAESWDEVHLDHDLGGERFVDHDRADCGMAVVRWLCDESRPHLQSARFFIHTHNPNGACVMTFHLQATGYRVEECPFGARPDPPTRRRPGLAMRMSGLLSHLLGRRTG